MNDYIDFEELFALAEPLAEDIGEVRDITERYVEEEPSYVFDKDDVVF